MDSQAFVNLRLTSFAHQRSQGSHEGNDIVPFINLPGPITPVLCGTLIVTFFLPALKAEETHTWRLLNLEKGDPA